MKKILIIFIILIFPFNVMAYGTKNFNTPPPSPSTTPGPENNQGNNSGTKQVSSESTGTVSNPTKENLSATKFRCLYKITSGYDLLATFTINGSTRTVQYNFLNKLLPAGSTESFTPQNNSQISAKYIVNNSQYTCPTLNYKKIVYTDKTMHYDLKLIEHQVTAPSTSDDYPVMGCKYQAGGTIGCAIDIVYIESTGKIEMNKWPCAKKIDTSNVCGEAFKNNSCPEMIINENDNKIELTIPSCVKMPGKENDKYSNIETCTDVDVNHIKACGCIPAEVADITSKVYFVLRLIGPIALLIIGGFEMAKAVASQDESSIEKAKKKLVNKFIAAAAIFLVLTIIKLGVSLVADNPDSMFECVKILLDGYVI